MNQNNAPLLDHLRSVYVESRDPAPAAAEVRLTLPECLNAVTSALLNHSLFVSVFALSLGHSDVYRSNLCKVETFMYSVL